MLLSMGRAVWMESTEPPLCAPVRRRYLGEKCPENSWTRRCSGDGDVVPQQLCLRWEVAAEGDRNEEDP